MSNTQQEELKLLLNAAAQTGMQVRPLLRRRLQGLILEKAHLDHVLLIIYMGSLTCPMPVTGYCLRQMKLHEALITEAYICIMHCMYPPLLLVDAEVGFVAAHTRRAASHIHCCCQVSVL